MRRQIKSAVQLKRSITSLLFIATIASSAVYADNWEELKASADAQKLQEYIRQNPASDHLVDAAALAYSKLLQQDNVSALLLFNEEFKDLVALPAFKAKSAAESGLDTRFTFREGKIGERYVPVLNHSSSSTNTRYINGRAITETTYNDYTTGGYSQDRYGFTAVYQLFNESNNNYIVDLTLSGTVTMTELNRQVAGVWSDEHHTTNVKQTKLEQQSSYLLKKGENVRDQLVVGEKQPADFKITISGITPVSDSWIEELQQILEADEDTASTAETKVEEKGVLQTIKGFWKSASELPNIISSKPEPLSQIEQYLADPRAAKWADILKQRYTETALKQLEITLEPEARYDRDFDSEVLVYIANKTPYDLNIEYQTNFGPNGRVKVENNKRSRLALRGKGVNKESLSFRVIAATNANPNKATAVKANITPAQLEAFKQRIAERDEEETYKQAKNILTLNAYLKKYPKGKYSKVAADRIEQIYFDGVKDITSAKVYLSSLPKGKRRTEVTEKLEQMYFNAATNIAGKHAYLDQLPHGSRRAEVAESLEPAYFAQSNSVEGARNYLQQYPTGHRSSEVMSKFWKQAGFRDNGDGTVTDIRSGLQWMRCSLGQRWNGSTCEGSAAKMNWNQAMQNARSLSYAGKSDWRIPTREELSSLVYCSSGQRESRQKEESGGRCQGSYQKPTIIPEVFPETPRGWFWSSHADFSTDAWGVVFDDGLVYNVSKFKNNINSVRLVRAGQ